MEQFPNSTPILSTTKTGCSVCLDTHVWELRWRTKENKKNFTPLGIRKW